MLNGEAMSSLMIYDLMPDFIPKPVGFVAYQQEQAAYFYLSEFVDMVRRPSRSFSEQELTCTK